MKKEAWKDLVERMIRLNDIKQLNLIVELLKDYEDAKQILREKGYWDFESMKSTVKNLK
jgi:hypothetical protein